MKAKPLYQREWILIVIFMVFAIVGNELQSAGDWKAVNWVSTIGLIMAGIARMICKSWQDQAGIKAGAQMQLPEPIIPLYPPAPPQTAVNPMPFAYRPPPVDPRPPNPPSQVPQPVAPVPNTAPPVEAAAPIPGAAKAPQAPLPPGSLNDDMLRLQQLGAKGQASINEQAVEDKREIVGTDGA